ncbi:hypothetical protein AMJ57_03870 [Parcubacteria bacterium SG8_24]|nr:MAG: hypothetical protein AMJ57_03870 [Parcubacteria bacterium SG8_24]
MTNREIADILREMSLLYEMDDVSFKPAAYEKAADSIGLLGREVKRIFEQEGRRGLDDIPGVGKAITEHIVALLTEGTFPEYVRMKKRIPADVLGLTAIEDIGPKTVKTLYRRLKIRTVRDLERAARAGRISRLPGFGKRTEQNILKNIGFLKAGGGRRLLGEILPLARELEGRLRRIPEVDHAVVAGSIRRRKETIGDMDVVVTTSSPKKVIDGFLSFPEIDEVLERGRTMVVVRLKNGLHADIRIVPNRSFGSALQHFTGNKEHNVIIRRHAASKGLKLNEYGLWRGKRRLASRTEQEVYRALGLPYIQPELRTASGELEAALEDRLPDIIPYGSVRGDLQVQTDWTDGVASIETMAEAAMELGHEYLAVTDHTKSLAMTGGLDDRQVARQAKEIDRLNASLRRRRKGFTILKGSEVDILKDGRLDLSDRTLARLDFVGAAIHSSFKLKASEQTERMIAAMRHPHVDAIFHPTGRIINKRPAYDLDMAAVLRAAKETGTAMEINAFPDRLDLRDAHVRLAMDLGVKLIIDTDAHAPEHLRYLDFGVAVARRGWARRRDVLNTRPLKSLLNWLKKPKDKRH